LETAIGGEEILTDENRDAEEVYLGLRTRRGLQLDPPELSVAELWKTAGWAEIAAPDDTNDRVRRQLLLTPTGWLRLDSLAADLAARRANRQRAA
jgi:oxygen-independent coproporphyrinogen-3 oxidase